MKIKKGANTRLPIIKSIDGNVNRRAKIVKMYNTTKIFSTVKPPKEVFKGESKPFEHLGIIFTPYFNKTTGTVLSYSGELKNMFLRYTKRGLFISNSWQKYYCNNNYSDYGFNEITDTYFRLNDQLQGRLFGGEVKSISMGIVIDEPAENLYPNWLFNKLGKTIRPMYDRSVTYGAKARFTDYSIKCYDKTFEAKSHDNITLNKSLTRIEKEVKYMKYFKGNRYINIRTVEDLIQPETHYQLGQSFLKSYYEIPKLNNMNYLELSPHELNVLAVMQNNDIREHLLAHERRRYKDYKSTYKKILAKLSDEDQERIDRKVKAKVEQLTNHDFQTCNILGKQYENPSITLPTFN